jgi:hypothetical protein
MDMFIAIEEMGYSTFLRESGSIWAFPMYLFLHTLGMATMVGGAVIISFALLGLWPKGVAIKPLTKLFPMMWAAFYVNLFTGVSIFMKDANSYGRNTDFYVKLVFVVAGVILMRRMKAAIESDQQLDKGLVSGSLKNMASLSLVCWFLAMVAGRLIAYVGPVPGL